MAAGPTLDEIMAAIRESGYLMEQEVATQLEHLEFHVRTNVAFEDLDEGKSREIDVTAIRRVAHNEQARMSAYVELIIECKNSSNPLVFLARPKNDADKHQIPQEYIFPYSYDKYDAQGSETFVRHVSGFYHLGFDDVCEIHKTAWKAVQFCRIDRKGGGWHANHGGLYDATFYPMAKSLFALKKKVVQGTRPGQWRRFWFFFPLIVTSGDLFLIDATCDTPTPTSVEHVTFQRELKSKDLSGSFMITFIRQRALRDFVTTSIEPIADRARKLVLENIDFVRDTKPSSAGIQVPD